MIDVRFEVKSWIEQNSLIIKFMWTLYNNLNSKHFIFESSNINKIKKLLRDYYYIQSVLVIENLPKLKTRIVQRNIPYEIEMLQCIFLESFPITILAVYEILKSFGTSIPRIYGKLFEALSDKKGKLQYKMFKETKYQKFGKTYRIKKKLQSKFIVTDEILKKLKLKFTDETLQFRFKLLQQCNFKTLQKNYKKSNIRCVWILKKNLCKFRFLGIPTLKDRVLQQIMTWSIHPISESQADSLSFGFRPQRSAKQAIAYVYRKLLKSKITRFKPMKTVKERFVSFYGKKAKFKSFMVFFGTKKKKRNRRYNYDY